MNFIQFWICRLVYWRILVDSLVGTLKFPQPREWLYNQLHTNNNIFYYMSKLNGKKYKKGKWRYICRYIPFLYVHIYMKFLWKISLSIILVELVDVLVRSHVSLEHLYAVYKSVLYTMQHEVHWGSKDFSKLVPQNNVSKFKI